MGNIHSIGCLCELELKKIGFKIRGIYLVNSFTRSTRGISRKSSAIDVASVFIVQLIIISGFVCNDIAMTI